MGAVFERKDTHALGMSVMFCALGPPICHVTPLTSAFVLMRLPLNGTEIARGLQVAQEAGHIKKRNDSRRYETDETIV
jgi:hypothetical protein